MVENGLSYHDLEARLRDDANHLKGGHSLTPLQRQTLVSGFIQAAVATDSHFSATEAYNLAYQVGPLLFNGDFSEVRRELLQKLAERTSYDSREVLEFLNNKKDQSAIIEIAELRAEIDPELALSWYKGAERRAFLHRIVELHQGNPKHRNLIVQSLTELGDTEGLLTFARRELSKDYGFATNILSTKGTVDDLRLIATTLENEAPSTAYRAARTLRGAKEKTPEDDALYLRLRAQLIQNHPDAAEKEFKRDEKKYPSYGSREEYVTVCTDSEGMEAVAMRYLELEKPIQALEAFSLIKQDGPEIDQAGLMLFKQKVDPSQLDNQYYWKRKCLIQAALQRAAVTYFRQGGDPLQVNAYIPINVGDEINRDLGKALADTPPEKPSDHLRSYRLETAYRRIRALGQREAQDDALLTQLRENLLQEDLYGFGANLFMAHEDEVGMRLFIERRAAQNPGSAYETACHLGDLELVNQMRKALIAHEDLRGAARVFSKAQDLKGLDMVRTQRTPAGLEPAIADYFLGKLELEKDDKKDSKF